ncbi:hypothetical protein OG520_01745 [Streptomyces sp. NBC_00984]|nr:hypothetical protein OG520_01745 [Streptomyces sp. NBC_00984]
MTRQIGERGRRVPGGEDEDIAGFLAGQDRTNGDARGPVVRAGQVLGTGDGRLDPAVEKAGVGGPGEGALPADLAERAAVPVALGCAS